MYQIIMKSFMAVSLWEIGYKTHHYDVQHGRDDERWASPPCLDPFGNLCVWNLMICAYAWKTLLASQQPHYIPVAWEYSQFHQITKHTEDLQQELLQDGQARHKKRYKETDLHEKETQKLSNAVKHWIRVLQFQVS